MADSDIVVRDSIGGQLDVARAALAQASTDFERLQIRDTARAVQEAADILKRKDVQVKASLLVSDAERAIAKANPPKPRGGDTTKTNVDSESTLLGLPSNDGPPPIGRDSLYQMRKAHSQTDEEYAAIKQKAVDKGEPLTRSSLAAGVQTTPHVARSTGNNEWYTPKAVIDLARTLMGGIELDPASTAIANQTVRADRYYTAEQDGLRLDWTAETLWLNPPYERQLVERFVDKLCLASKAGTVGKACLLVNNATETAWGQKVLANADCVLFFNRRIRFHTREGEVGGPLQGQILACFGADPNEVSAISGDWGIVLGRLP